MGYAGYSPGLRTEGPKTPLEETLRALPPESAKACLDLMETLLRNVIQHPSEEKYRKIRLTNEKISKTITTVPGAVDSLVLMGWEQQDENLVLPMATKLDFPSSVNKVLEAKGWYAKKEAQARGARTMVGDNPPVPTAPAKPAAQMNLRELREGGIAAATPAQAPTPTPAQAPAPADPPKQAGGDKWACPQCTFENEASSSKCEMCDVQKPGAAAAPVSAEAPKSAPIKSANNFERKLDVAQVAQQNSNDVSDLRELRKQQYKEAEKQGFKGDEYKRPASTSNGSTASSGGWFDGWFGSGSSSSNNKPQGGGGGNRDGKPRMKTINDLPKPVRRGG